MLKSWQKDWCDPAGSSAGLCFYKLVFASEKHVETLIFTRQFVLFWVGLSAREVTAIEYIGESIYLVLKKEIVGSFILSCVLVPWQ